MYTHEKQLPSSRASSVPMNTEENFPYLGRIAPTGEIGSEKKIIRSKKVITFISRNTLGTSFQQIGCLCNRLSCFLRVLVHIVDNQIIISISYNSDVVSYMFAPTEVRI